MRPTTVVLILVILISVIAAILTEHQRAQAHTGYYRVAQTAGDGLRLRTGPSGDYRIIMVMARGARLKAYGHRGNWMKVKHLSTGYIGWASMTYIVADTATSGGGGGGSGGGLQTCFWNYWGRTVCAPYWIAQEFANAAAYYGASYWWLMSVAACESDLNPNAYNPAGPTGIMQFHWSTIQSFGWPGANPWSVHDSAWVAAKMFSQGLGYTHWHCFRLIAG